MYRLVPLPPADSVDLVREGDVVAVCFMRADADNGAWLKGQN